MVDGFMGTPKKPISPAVIISGNRLGMMETKIILKLLNIQAINKAINRIANESDIIRLFTKYFVPF